ncbi:hypothetical protein VTK26DRAFT_5964 [Humicola hyalothermophila]
MTPVPRTFRARSTTYLLSSCLLAVPRAYRQQASCWRTKSTAKFAKSMERMLLELSRHLLSTTPRERFHVTPIRALRGWLSPGQASDIWENTFHPQKELSISSCIRGRSG